MSDMTKRPTKGPLERPTIGPTITNDTGLYEVLLENIAHVREDSEVCNNLDKIRRDHQNFA
jgi:hypothetical protein